MYYINAKIMRTFIRSSVYRQIIPKVIQLNGNSTHFIQEGVFTALREHYCICENRSIKPFATTEEAASNPVMSLSG